MHADADTPIYLDHNATTPLLPEVVDAMLPYLRTEFGNPSSNHAWGRRAREAVEQARSQVANLLGCSADDITFTSGGTEANNLAIRGVADAAPRGKHVITSVVEHPATSNPCRLLEGAAWSVHWAAVDSECRVRVEDVERALSDQTALVTIMHANNETGTIEPIAELAALAHRHGAVIHTDAAQSVGKIPVQVDALGVDLLTVAGHKLNAPKGVGALYVRRGTPIRPVLLGAGHERGLRPGTENVAGIVGLGAACHAAAVALESKTAALRGHRDRLWTLLKRAIPDLRANADATERLPNTLSVRFPFVRGSDVLSATPEVAASTGSACHAGHESASGVLLAMGMSADEALRTVRLSVGSTSTSEDVERAADALVRGWQRASGRA